MTRYYARSASDRTDDWPYWYVADREQGGLNVTVRLAREVWGLDRSAMLPFMNINDAMALADEANGGKPTDFVHSSN